MIEYPDIDKCVIQWFICIYRSNSVNLDDQIIKGKAQTFAVELGHKVIKASNGWLEKYKKRYKNSFWKSAVKVIVLVTMRMNRGKRFIKCTTHIIRKPGTSQYFEYR